MRILLLAFGLFLISEPFLCAQSSVDTTKASIHHAFVLDFDAYWRYAETGTPSIRSSSLSHNAISPGWLSVGYEGTKGKVSLNAQLAFGPRAEEFLGDADGIFSNVAVMSVAYQLSKRGSFQIGVLESFYGLEANDPSNNTNFSLSYSNSISPASLTGASYTHHFSKEWSAMFGIFNSITDQLDIDENKLVGTQINYESNKTTLTWNAIGGTENDGSNFIEFDINGTFELSSRFSLGADYLSRYYQLANDRKGHYLTGAAFFDFTVLQNSILSLRTEYFYDQGGVFFNQAASVWAATLTGNFPKGALVFMPEIRYDKADGDVFGNETSSEWSVILGVACRLD